MHAPTTASSTEVSTRIWMHVPYAVHCVTILEKDDPGDVEGEPPRKRVPAKVMWYSPIIPRLKRLFRNKDNAKLMRWHKEEHKKDSMLRHPADGSQWRKIDRTYPEFDLDARNIRSGLSTDGMNPFGEMSSGHSTWPVTLC